MKIFRLAAAAVAAAALAACNSDRATAPLMSDARADGSSGNTLLTLDEGTGVVYTLSNQASGNALLRFNRAPDGSLTPAGSFPTGGLGLGAGLGSQNALTYNRFGTLLFAVNAGSNSVSAFRFVNGTPVLVSTAPSGGVQPISVTSYGNLVYVLNAGGSGNIAGFRVENAGVLMPIANSSRPLSTTAAGPAQIEFDANGQRLIVTEKATNTIDTYLVAANGLTSLGQFTPSSGATPFGFAFRRDVLIVAEAFGGATDQSAASSYTIRGTGAYPVVSGTVPTTETAACWTIVSNNGQFAYVTNTGSGTITGYSVSAHGVLTPLTANGETAILGAGTAPADMALSGNGRYLYARNGGTKSISVVRVNADGTLTVLPGGVSGLPSGTVGLAAR